MQVIQSQGRAGWLCPILHVMLLQLLADHATFQRGTNVDKPRNLAKSVTVEQEGILLVGGSGVRLDFDKSRMIIEAQPESELSLKV